MSIDKQLEVQLDQVTEMFKLLKIIFTFIEY